MLRIYIEYADHTTVQGTGSTDQLEAVIESAASTGKVIIDWSIEDG